MYPSIPAIIALIRFFKWLNDRPKLKAEQAERDRLAQEIAKEAERRLIAEILSGSHIPPFSLYLRPFTLERTLREYQETLLPHTLFTLPFRKKMNFDYILQNYFTSLGITLISIGAPNDKEGAGHVVTPDELWRERFRQLAERAIIIVVVPGIQSGIMSEIRWLRVSGLLVNAVFFKPRGYPKAEWQKVQELYEQEEDIELPDYSPKQLSFHMYSSGRCHNIMTWNTVYRKSKREHGSAQMKALLSNRPVDFN